MTVSNKYWQCTECNYNSSNLPEIKLHEHDNLTLVEETKPTASNNRCSSCGFPKDCDYHKCEDCIMMDVEIERLRQ